jgi:hypothetical protein
MREATTFDHLPPACLFPKPRPNDLVTVPACFNCNNAASKDDEAFRVFLSLQIGMETPTIHSLWKDGALRTLQHNARLKQRVVDQSWQVDLRTPAGIFLGKRRVIRVPVHTHNAVIDRIVRGLYFHHFGEVLGNRVACHVRPLKNVSPETIPIWNLMSFSSVGEDAFAYRYGRSDDSKLDSLWIMLFYARYWVMADTRPKSHALRGLPAGAT